MQADKVKPAESIINQIKCINWVPGIVVPTLKSGILDRRCQENYHQIFSRSDMSYTVSMTKKYHTSRLQRRLWAVAIPIRRIMNLRLLMVGAKQFAQCLWSWLPHWLCISHNYSQCSYNTQLWRLCCLGINQGLTGIQKQMLTTLAFKPWFMCLIRILWFKNFATEDTNVTLI